ncbi:MAG: nucleotidyltransferase family protein [Nitrososphaerales archaeon]
MSKPNETRKVACIILAAGMSTRFGSLKQLVEIEGRPLLQRAVDIANDSNADYVILVIGAHSSEILGKVQTGRAQVVFNKDYERGQSTSLRCGIANLPDDCAGTIIMVADQPFLKSEYLNEMILIFEQKCGDSEVVALSHAGEPRNPVLVPKELFPIMSEIKGDIGARSVIQNYDKLRLVEIQDERAFLDVDTKQSVSILNTGKNLKKLPHREEFAD